MKKNSTSSGLSVSALVLVAILLAAGFILNMTVGKALAVTGIQPEFVISSYCLAILLIGPTVPQSVAIGMLAATVIQLTTSIPGLEYVCDLPASALLGVIVGLFGARDNRRSSRTLPLLATFVTTLVSGSIFALAATTVVLRASVASAFAMAPVVLGTAVANAMVVGALYAPLSAIVRKGMRLQAKEVPVPEGDAPLTGHLIELRHVSYSYAGASSRALDDLSLTIDEGDFLGVIGPSGAGKSTLASLLSGAIPHHFGGRLQGQVSVCGMSTFTAPLTDISLSVGTVLQDIDTQMVASNVEDEMLYGLENFGIDKAEVSARIDEALGLVGIANLRHREIATLSGGQKQKVAIAAMVAIRPSVMVLDEPTAALDPVSSESVFEVLRRLNREYGVTVVVIEQKVSLLSKHCGRVAVMANGRMAIEGPVRDVFSKVDELDAVGVECPRVTSLWHNLSSRGLEVGMPALTLDEGGALIDAALRKVPPAAVVARSCTKRLGGRAPSGERVLDVSHVRFSYGRGMASLCDVNISVRAGEFVAIVGQNGAGKSTLVKLLNGTLKPMAGTVRVAGQDTASCRTSVIARDVSTLFQNPDHQLCKDTVLDEVAFSLELLGVRRDEALARAQEVVDDFGLPAGQAPFSLSRGQRQIVALASVVVTNPRVLILDEPTSGLDYRECKVVMDAVEGLRKRGCAVVMVCHDMEVVQDYATRLVVMGQGLILADGDPYVLFRDHVLMEEASVSAPQLVQLSQRLKMRYRHILWDTSTVDAMALQIWEMVR